MLCSLLVSGHDFKNNIHYMNIGGLSWVMAYFSAITLIFQFFFIVHITMRTSAKKSIWIHLCHFLLEFRMW